MMLAANFEKCPKFASIMRPRRPQPVPIPPAPVQIPSAPPVKPPVIVQTTPAPHGKTPPKPHVAPPAVAPAPPPVAARPPAEEREVIPSLRLVSDPGEFLPNCNEPGAVGWLGAVAEARTYGTALVYDMHFPAQVTSRSGPADQIPALGEILTFSAQYPAPLYQASIACVVDHCGTAPVTGPLVVLHRIHYSGQHAQTYWQLCLGRATGRKDI